MLADTKGMLSENREAEPFVNLAVGVFSTTLSGEWDVLVRRGTSRNSEKVLEISLIIFATRASLCNDNGMSFLAGDANGNFRLRFF
jgi:hypothetical protein